MANKADRISVRVGARSICLSPGDGPVTVARLRGLVGAPADAVASNEKGDLLKDEDEICGGCEVQFNPSKGVLGAGDPVEETIQHASNRYGNLLRRLAE